MVGNNKFPAGQLSLTLTSNSLPVNYRSLRSTMSTSTELKLELLNQKMDRLIEMFEKVIADKTTKPKRERTDQPPTTDYSIEDINEHQFIVKFSFDLLFKEHIKKLGGFWLVAKRGWMFSITQKEFVSESLQNTFPTWTLKASE
jgi:hypothetical protein